MEKSNILNNIFKAIINKTGLNSSRHPARMTWIQEKIYKHTDDISEKKINIHGLLLVFRHRHSLFATYEEIFIREIYKFNNVSENSVIIDCGANIGIGTLYFAQKYPNAHIIAFEPDEENFRLLQTNVQNNKIKNSNIDLIKKAVWINNGGISFHADGTEGSKIVEEKDASKIVVVETQSLKELLQKYSSIDFLKIDIEGAEYKVLKDCIPELPKVKNMFLEYHGLTSETYKLKEIITILNDQHFSVYINMADDSIQKPFVDKRSKNDFDVQLNIFCYRN